MSIIQIVGFQNSGKTTFAQKLIGHFKQSGMQVGIIKHHGHLNGLDIYADKDTGKLFEAGADVAIPNSPMSSEMFMRQDFGLKRSVALMQRQNMDVILIEGYKHAPYPKIVLLSKVEDLVLLETLQNIIGVYCTHGFILPPQYERLNLDMVSWLVWLEQHMVNL